MSGSRQSLFRWAIVPLALLAAWGLRKMASTGREVAAARDPGREVPPDVLLEPMGRASGSRLEQSPPVQANDRPGEAKLFVTNQRGDHLAGVQVWIRPIDGVEREYRPLEEGGDHFLVSVQGRSQAYQVLASMADYETLESRLQLRDGAEEHLVMADGGSIRGWVTGTDGGPSGECPFVLAYPDDHRPSLDRLARALEGGPSSIAVVRADRNGLFTITGLGSDATYSLVAGGNGVASPSATRGIVTGTTPVELKVEAVFGLRLVFEGLEPGSPSLWSRPGPMWTWDPDPDYRGVGTDSPIALLAGIGLEETRRSPLGSLALLFVGSTALQEVGPVRLSGTLAGYEPLDREFHVPRCDGRLPDALVSLSPLAKEWGAVHVRFSGLAPERERVERKRPLGIVRLDSLDGGETFEQRLVGFDPLVLDHVPAGSYAMTLSTEAGYWNFPSSEDRVTVSPFSPAEARFDLRHSCALELAIVRLDGELFEGEATFHLSSADGGGAQFISFLRAPYRIAGLVPGSYSVRIYEPFQDKTPLRADLSLPGREASAVFEEF